MDTAPAQPWRASLPGAVGIGLLLVMVAAMWLQAQQYAQLPTRVHGADDRVALTIHQTEADYLRLREAWGQAIQEQGLVQGGEDALALRQRYDNWNRRLNVLSAEQVQNLLSGQADPALLNEHQQEHQQTLSAMQAFAQRADTALGPAPSTAATPEFYAELWPALSALGGGVQRLSNAAARQMTALADSRKLAVRQSVLSSLVMTGLLCLVAAVFAALAWDQFRQISQRRQALQDQAAQLRQAQREAQAASDAKGLFLANISHEIRTPFHGLMGMLSLLRETGLNAHQIDLLRTATESADHLLAILNDVLDMSQLETGRMTLAPAPTDLRVVLRDVEALMRPQANAKALALHLDADPGVPERLVLDATRVKQVLLNLLSNAIKFSDHGTVMLDVRIANASPPMLKFIVTDTGLGMDAATHGSLFKRSGQGDASISRQHGGTGLGLEISRDLACLMGGDITVRSKPGQGSVFQFSLPMVTAAQTSDDVARQAHALHGAGGNEEQARPLRVLVAEDHPVNRQYLAALLENMGHQAHFTANGQEAVQAAREHSFDVVLMDLHMPVLDGLGATQAIRALPDRAAAAVPIFALTADAFEQTRERCLVAGMNDFLTKPVSPQKLATSLRRLFGNTGVVPPAEPLPSSALTDPLPTLLPLHRLAIIDNTALHMALQAMPKARLLEMTTSFLDQAPETVQRLRAAIRDTQPLEVRVNAHAAKGAALNLGLAGLAATAAALHEGAAHLPAHEIARLVQRYEELLPLTRQALVEAGLTSEAVGPG